jgi:signal transduction histidine kinase
MATEAPDNAAVAALELRLEALETATIALTAEPSLEHLLQLIVDLVRPVAAARYAAIGIATTEGVLERFVTSGISAETRAAIGPLPVGHGLLGVIVRENRTIRVHDVMADTQRSGFPPHHPPMHSFLGTPVKVQGRSVGNLYLTEKVGAGDFTDDDVRIVETFARYAGIAMQNARLNAELGRLAVLTERERIGQDLHDGVIQSLYGVGLSLEDLGDVMREEPDAAEARVEQAIDAIHGTIRDLRSFIFGLRPEFLEAGDLRTALGALADEFRRMTAAIVNLTLVGSGDVPPAVAIHVLQLAREALSNVARHADATSVSVSLMTTPAEVHLAIVDNGNGFDASQSAAPGHHGLSNMLERARAIGGQLDVRSGKGGTQVDLRVPLPMAGEAVETS